MGYYVEDGDMNTKDIDYILEIAKCQSISRAARNLYISQPALSRFLSNLEEELQTPLFIREKNTLTLTDAGTTYVEYAFAVRQLTQKMLDDIETINFHNKDVLKVGYTMASNFLSFYQISQEFNQMYPSIELKFTRVYDRDIKEGLEDTTLTFGLSTQPEESGSSLDYYNCFESPMLIVVPKHMDITLPPSAVMEKPDCKYPWIDIKAITDQPFALQSDKCRIRKQIDFILGQMDINLANVPITTDNSLTALLYTEQGYTLCISTESTVRHLHLEERCNLYCFGEPPAIRKNGILYLKSKKFSRQEKDCFNLLKKHLINNGSEIADSAPTLHLPAPSSATAKPAAGKA